tara:strand:- start:11486 stop:11863 length:378 start_codon:yes stop_codon:yes gene_type:complete
MSYPTVAKSIPLFASAARTATPTAVDFVSEGASGLFVVIDCTAKAATPSVVFTVQLRDTTSGKLVDLLASAAVTTTGTTTLRVGRGLVAATNLTVNDMVPNELSVKAVHGDTDSITYTVSAILVV